MAKTLKFDEPQKTALELETTPGGTNNTLLDKVINMTGGGNIHTHIEYRTIY